MAAAAAAVECRAVLAHEPVAIAALTERQLEHPKGQAVVEEAAARVAPSRPLGALGTARADHELAHPWVPHPPGAVHWPEALIAVRMAH